jgi:hypothetical protein
LTPHRSDHLAAIDRHLWRDLGFTDPEPQILRFLPMLVVAWADGRLSDGERDHIRDRARGLAPHLRKWLDERLQFPPGPYFRYQVTHLLTFMLTVWTPPEGSESTWAEMGTEWADELIQEGGWLRRLFGGVAAEARDLTAIRDAMHEGRIPVPDQIWALARGAHAEGTPRRAVAILPDHKQDHQALGIVIEAEDETRFAVGAYVTLARDEDLDPARVERILANTRHIRDVERWVMLTEEVHAGPRPITERQKEELANLLSAEVGGPFSEIPFAELCYLEDALALDARWVSWVAGYLEELRIDRDEVRRPQTPGTFYAPREKVRAHVSRELIAGPEGLAFRVLNLEATGESLRLALPVLQREPASKDAIAWIARFLGPMCDPYTQLVLDQDGPRWVAEVWPQMAREPSPVFEPLLPGRSLVVPPWVWYRACDAMGLRRKR